ncbi:hypothetical protein CCP3SC5AM1_3040003 [Gammaproteobacteria bacterium]
MTTFDARTLSHSTLEYIRIQAIKAVQVGNRIRTVAKIFGIHRSTLHKWLKMFRKHGMESLKENHVPGKKSFLNKGQQSSLRFYVSAFTNLRVG